MKGTHYLLAQGAELGQRLHVEHAGGKLHSVTPGATDERAGATSQSVGPLLHHPTLPPNTFAQRHRIRGDYFKSHSVLSGDSEAVISSLVRAYSRAPPYASGTPNRRWNQLITLATFRGTV